MRRSGKRRRAGVQSGVLAAVLLLVGWWAGPALASPVNAERLRSDPGTDGWSGSLDVRAALARGNVERLDLGYGGGVQYLTHHPAGVGFGSRPTPVGAPPFFRDRWTLLVNGAFGQVADNTIVNRGFAHTRYTRMWIPRLGSDLFVQGQYDQITRLRSRVVGGVGLRVDAVHRRVIQIWAGTAYMPEYEVNDTVEGDPHPERVVNHRWTSYGSIQLVLFPEGQLMVRNTAYVQPRFDAFDDVRVLENLQLEAAVTPVLALGADFLLQYDSDPPQEVVPLDMTLGSYLRLRFR